MLLREIHEAVDGSIQNHGIGIQQQYIRALRLSRGEVVRGSKAQILRACNEPHLPELLTNRLRRAVFGRIVDHNYLKRKSLSLTKHRIDARQRHFARVVTDDDDRDVE